jgi:hypothetical protein
MPVISNHFVAQPHNDDPLWRVCGIQMGKKLRSLQERNSVLQSFAGIGRTNIFNWEFGEFKENRHLSLAVENQNSDFHLISHFVPVFFLALSGLEQAG